MSQITSPEESKLKDSLTVGPTNNEKAQEQQIIHHIWSDAAGASGIMAMHYAFSDEFMTRKKLEIDSRKKKTFVNTTKLCVTV